IPKPPPFHGVRAAVLVRLTWISATTTRRKTGTAASHASPRARGLRITAPRSEGLGMNVGISGASFSRHVELDVPLSRHARHRDVSSCGCAHARAKRLITPRNTAYGKIARMTAVTIASIG